jgi:hydroxymethylpyrimidine pyrophosphatase-like HAD family hydrolase
LRSPVSVAAHLHCSLNEFAGIGDNESDWDFIQFCGYGAAVANASVGLKALLQKKEQRFRAILPDVDENGAIEIFLCF